MILVIFTCTQALAASTKVSGDSSLNSDTVLITAKQGDALVNFIIEPTRDGGRVILRSKNEKQKLALLSQKNYIYIKEKITKIEKLPVESPICKYGFSNVTIAREHQSKELLVCFKSRSELGVKVNSLLDELFILF